MLTKKACEADAEKYAIDHDRGGFVFHGTELSTARLASRNKKRFVKVLGEVLYKERIAAQEMAEPRFEDPSFNKEAQVISQSLNMAISENSEIRQENTGLRRIVNRLIDICRPPLPAGELLLLVAEAKKLLGRE